MKKFMLMTVVMLISVVCANATDLIQNGSFEIAGTDAQTAQSWQWANPDQNGGSWGCASREQWRAHSGTYEATLRGSWSGSAEGGWWQQAVAEPRVTYTASAWFWADSDWSAGEQGMKIEFFDSALASPIHAVTNIVSGMSESWIQKSIQAVAPENTEWVRVVVFASNVGADGALQFDDVSLIAEPGTVIVISGVSSFALLLVVLLALYSRNRKQ